MSLTKRSTKGSALTYDEMDANFTHLGGDGSYAFPATDGNSNEVLVTDGAGNLEFTTINVDNVSFENFTTTSVPEGNNLYYTDARVRAAISATGSINYDSSTGTFSFTQGDTDTITEGTTNLYHTVERVQDVVGGMVDSNTESGIDVTYNDTTGKLNFNVSDPTIALSGDVTGSATMTNLGSITITTTVGNDSHTHDGRYYTETEVDTLVSTEISTAIDNLLDGAPNSLDTLNELAAAINDDSSYATTLTTALATKLNSSAYTASDVLTKIKTVDGTGSGLDADTLDGYEASAFALVGSGQTYSGNQSFTGNVTVSGTTTTTALNIGSTSISEYIADTVGSMVTSNSESGISVVYQDADNTLDFDVGDFSITLSGAVTGSGTVTNLGNVSIATTATSDPTLTLSGDASGSATFTNLGNATLNVTVANSSGNFAVGGALTAGGTITTGYRIYGHSFAVDDDNYLYFSNQSWASLPSVVNFVLDNSTRCSINGDGDLNATGDISATSFSGNGASLTSVNADTVDGLHASSFTRADITGASKLAVGTTAQRPTLGASDYGYMRYNTSLEGWEYWNGSAWKQRFVLSVDVQYLAVGGGGGGGGGDGGGTGGSGGSGALVTGTFPIDYGEQLTIIVGGGGSGGVGNQSNAAGGSGGSSSYGAGGRGGNAGGSGSSGGGGGGGGASAITATAGTVCVAGGGGGNGGSNEGSQNEAAAGGGGVVTVRGSTGSSTGGAGFNYSGDGGGGGGGGGGYVGGNGQTQGNSDGASGGTNYHGAGTQATTTVNGPNGASNDNTTQPAASWSGSSGFGYSSNKGQGGYGVTSGNGQTGGAGVVIIRYAASSQLGTGGTVTSSGGYYIHTFTSNGTFSL